MSTAIEQCGVVTRKYGVEILKQCPMVMVMSTAY